MRIRPQVKGLGKVVTFATQNLWLKVLKRGPNPFAGQLHSVVAIRAPSVSPWIVGVGHAPKEPDAPTVYQPLNDMLADQGLRLVPMRGASNPLHDRSILQGRLSWRLLSYQTERALSPSGTWRMNEQLSKPLLRQQPKNQAVANIRVLLCNG
jgi:hypothetical protein